MKNLLTLLLLSLLAVPSFGQTAPDATLERYEAALARDPGNAFYRYAVAQTARRLDREPPSLPTIRAGQWREQLYEMTTGAWAVQESLQLDRLAGTGETVSPATVPIDSIEGVATPSIPFETLLEGKLPVIEPLASAAPADWYYLHAPRVASLRRTLETMERWGAHMLSAYTLDGREPRLRAKLERQLILGLSPELDQFYDLAGGETILVGSDPFLAEGSDVTAVIQLGNPEAFRARIEQQRREAVSSSRGRVSLLHERYRTWVVDAVFTSDRSISSYVTIREKTAIVSNSYAALRTVADVVDRLAPSMAGSDDFRYMRAIKPYNQLGEDAFLFLSDAFVRRVVGPRLKIGEARRVRCAASLQTIAYALMMYRGELRSVPATVDELASRGYLDRALVRCPDGGKYSLDGDVPVCSVHNRMRALTPNLELRIDRVAPEEAESYAAFRENYKQYWRRFVDPVGIRARFDHRLTIDATVLPLVENSAYSALASIVGKAPVALARPQSPGAIATLDLKSPYATGADPSASPAGLLGGETEAIGRALGDSFSIQVADGAATLAPSVAGVLAGDPTGSFGTLAFLAPLLSALVLPTAIVAPVRDRAALETALARFRAEITRDQSGGSLFGVDGYQIVQGGSRTVEAISIRLLTLQLRFYYTVSGDRFVVANDRELLESLATSAVGESASGTARLELAPVRWNRILPAMGLAYAEDSRRVCLENVPWLEALATAFAQPPRDLEDESLALLGIAFACPGGGRYVAGADGRVECALHGTPEAPRQGPTPQPGSPAAFILEGVRRLEATLAFTDEGLTTQIVVE